MRVGLDGMLKDEEVLMQLGYKQVLHRGWGVMTAIAISISGMSVLTSIAASFKVGLAYGGPAVCIWGWIAVSAVMLCVALGMSELASAYPTSGGFYYWHYKMAGERWGPLACWLTDVSATAFLCTDLITTIARLSAAEGGAQYIEFTPLQNLGICGGVLVLVSLLNSGGQRVLALCTQLGGVLQVAGLALLALMVPLLATSHQPASWVFGHFEAGPANDKGIFNVFNIAILGLLMPSYAYTGMGDVCHMSEEIQGASTGPTISIMCGWGVMFVGGLGLVISLLFSITSIEHVLSDASSAGGNAVAQILYDVSLQRFGTGAVGIGLLGVVLLGVFFCCVAVTTTTSRTLFSYSRDHAIPFSSLWVKIDTRTKLPIMAVWGVTFAAFCLGLPMLGSVTAFNAVLSLATVSSVIVTVTPITARCTWGCKSFKAGQYSLGAWAHPLGVISTLWMVFSTVVFCLPTALPATAETFNYASIGFIGTCMISLTMFFFPRYGAYKWFKGPGYTTDSKKGDSTHISLDAAVACKDADVDFHNVVCQ